MQRPAACPADAPRTSLTVKRGTRAYDYIDQRSSCSSAARPVTNATIAALVAELDALTMTDRLPVGASTCEGSPCFALKGTCADAYPNGFGLAGRPTYRVEESYANITMTYHPQTGLSQLTWLNPGTMGTSRATQRLDSWLRNSPSITADGEKRGMTTYWEGAYVDVFVRVEQAANAIELTMSTTRGVGFSGCHLTAELD